MRLIVIEGLPGSGKTSSAEWIARRLGTAGVPAVWFREERADHPVIDRPLMKTSREPGFAERCVAGWRAFAARAESAPADRVWVLEGCLFQSTVRFMLEHDHPSDAPRRYLSAVERSLAALRPGVVHLVHASPRDHLRDQLEARKSADFVDRIAAYTETTACARRSGWTGREALVEFYDRYGRTCRALLDRSPLPRIELDATRLSFDEVTERLETWLRTTGLIPARDVGGDRLAVPEIGSSCFP